MRVTRNKNDTSNSVTVNVDVLSNRLLKKNKKHHCAKILG